VRAGVYRFLDCELDLPQRQLRRAGGVVQVEPLILDLLAFLVVERDRVVSRQEILAAVWKGHPVGSSAVNACMSRARRAIGDRRGRSGAIRTFSGVGYRLIAEVQAGASGGGARAPLLGREVELARLDAIRDAVRAGSGRTVLIAAAAGIGKTRLARQLADDCEASGFEVLWGHCDAMPDLPFFWPWTQILQAAARTRSTSALAALARGCEDELARVSPSLRERLRAGVSPDASLTDESRLRVFEATTTCLLRAAAQRPLALVIDDLQWSDPASILLLCSLQRAIAGARVLLVGLLCTRSLPERAATAGVAALLHHPDVVALHLDPLPGPQIERLLRAECPSLTPAIVDTIAALAGGNPQVAVELGRATQGAAAAASVALVAPDDLPIPDRLATAALTELAALSADSRSLVEAAAIFARPFSIGALAHLTGRLPADACAAVEEAVERGVLVASAAATTFAFRSDLTRECTRRALNPLRRQRLLSAARAPARGAR